MPDQEKEQAPVAVAKPQRALLRMYRHGLGDCIYLEFPRGSGPPYRIMIDCGLVLGAADAKAKITGVMDHVIESSGADGLDLLVVTHPHWDHVSGFVQAESVDQLKAREVWLAWSENPQDELAAKLKSTFALAEQALRAGLTATEAFPMNAARKEAESLLGFLGLEQEGEAKLQAGKGRTTAAAVAAAAAKAAEAGRKPHFCLPGEKPFVIPGTTARIFVLGPPRDEKELRQMDPSKREPETYSLTALGSLLHLGQAFAALAGGDAAQDQGRPFAQHFTLGLEDCEAIPFFADHYFGEAAQWQRIDADWVGEIAPLALLLDRAVNNSSLALAIELEEGGDVILLAADAQVGNWRSWLKLKWELDGRTVTGPDLIARTLAYKVGHHASLNATLAKEGVEKMERLRYSLVPVDAEQASARGWGNNIPFPKLLTALAGQGPEDSAAVLRSDRAYTGKDPAIKATDLFFEISL